MLNEEILISPIITEKSSMLQESNKYVFKVHKNSNKSQIKNAVEEVFDVTVESVNVIKVKGCLLYTSPSPRDLSTSRMPSSA